MLGLVLVTSLPAAAQSARSSKGALPIPFCSDSTSSPFRERLLLVLEYDGANRRDLWSAIDMAADMHSRCIVARGDLPPADTSVYGIVHVNALESGGYEIATWLGGPRASRTLCRSARAAIVTGDAPITWGVVLSHTISRFVECAVAARGTGEVRRP